METNERDIGVKGISKQCHLIDASLAGDRRNCMRFHFNRFSKSRYSLLKRRRILSCHDCDSMRTRVAKVPSLALISFRPYIISWLTRERANVYSALTVGINGYMDDVRDPAGPIDRAE